MNALALVSFLFENVFQVKKSNGVLRKEHFTPGAIQLNDVKMTDPPPFWNWLRATSCA